VEGRKDVYDYLRSKNIFSQVHYIPVYTLPYYQSLGFKKDDFPHAENYYAKCLSLPMFPTLTESEQDYVIDTIKDYLS
jgi:dTDP-4-amino-4,6-dideoxygalactose transaminase